MKIIHLKCGHKLSVKTWPSRIGLAKVRHHYKKFHPTRMKKMTKKSLATKRRKGIINPRLEGLKSKLIREKRQLEQLRKRKLLNVAGESRLTELNLILSGWNRRKGLIKNRCNPKPKYHKVIVNGKHRFVTTKQLLELRHLSKMKSNPGALIYDRTLRVEAQKQHGKFKGKNFYHDFSRDTDAVITGNKDGSLTIRSKKGKPLWKRFKY